MKRSSILAALLACFIAGLLAPAGFAGEPNCPQRCPHCGGGHGGGAHGGQGNYYGSGSGSGGYGLPQGRRYYNGRYFGTLNNRYYGPQYGYF